MDLYELKKEQQRLSQKVVLNDGFDKVKTLGGACTISLGNKLLACIVVCEFPSLNIIEKKIYSLSDPIPYHPGYSAYREMPALIEAYNLLEQEPDVLIVKGSGILHPRKIGLATHLGLALNRPTIGVDEKLSLGKVEKGKIIVHNEICGFEVKTREFSNPLYISPGQLISIGTSLNIIKNSIKYPHKFPEPLHLAHKIGKYITKEKKDILPVIDNKCAVVGEKIC
ncbi:endonuclease V [Candidatus Woesearchaeota archaeon]|nr:endonuclease V [Candidatus Woesearchaeota archaeon]